MGALDNLWVGAVRLVLEGEHDTALVRGDTRQLLRELPDACVDAIVTDPPYELGFMGKAWDKSGIANDPAMWADALRVLKPGGHLLAFSGARTYHRMVCAIEDAGFEIRDQIMWVYGSGMPKSRNVAKYDMAGADAEEWEGWGTGLKPAHEPIVVARKPLAGTVAGNLLAHGVGAYHIDACRVGMSAADRDDYIEKRRSFAGAKTNDGANVTFNASKVLSPEQLIANSAQGRWPANLIHDGSAEVLALFPAADGAHSGVKGAEPSMAGTGLQGRPRKRLAAPRVGGAGGVGFAMGAGERREDVGSAARFFYCPKATRKDRNDGCDSAEVPAVGSGATMRDCEEAKWSARNGNDHPTVKPTELMRYLVRLVARPGAVVLDPFMGSGSTGRGARLEGCRFVGFDLDAHNVDIAGRRIRAVQAISPAPATEPAPTPEKTPPAPAPQAGEASPQLDLLENL